MDNDEILQKLSTLEKKVDKTLNLLTKIGKALHLIPVTEKEERAMQIAQRTNLAQAAKINHELDVMENKDVDSSTQLSLESFYNNIDDSNVYDGIIDTDYLGG